jgi:hypothetical protein
LRELSLHDLKLVVDFIKKNYRHFSREGLRYAIEKMDNKLKKQLMDYDPDDLNQAEIVITAKSVAAEKKTKTATAKPKKANPAKTAKEENDGTRTRATRKNARNAKQQEVSEEDEMSEEMVAEESNSFEEEVVKKTTKSKTTAANSKKAKRPVDEAEPEVTTTRKTRARRVQ